MRYIVLRLQTPAEGIDKYPALTEFVSRHQGIHNNSNNHDSI